jgi:hypothetical protein
MAGRTLRNRTVEPSHGDDETFMQDSESDWPQEQPEQLGNIVFGSLKLILYAE